MIPPLEVKIKLWSMKKVIAHKQMRENKNLLETMDLNQKLSKKKQQNSVLLIQKPALLLSSLRLTSNIYLSSRKKITQLSIHLVTTICQFSPTNKSNLTISSITMSNQEQMMLLHLRINQMPCSTGNPQKWKVSKRRVTSGKKLSQAPTASSKNIIIRMMTIATGKLNQIFVGFIFDFS